MTRITPHQQHIANKAAMAMSRTDIKCSIGYCAIPTAKVQLLALRYGLIEPGAATATRPPPTRSKPLLWACAASPLRPNPRSTCNVRPTINA